MEKKVSEKSEKNNTAGFLTCRYCNAWVRKGEIRPARKGLTEGVCFIISIK